MSVLEDQKKEGAAGVMEGSNSAGALLGRPDWLSLVMGLLSRRGGLQAMISKFDQGGLGPIISSWISTGANSPVRPDQIRDVLREDLSELAAEAGTDAQAAAVGVAEVLPSLIDQLTPNGEPVEGDALQQGLRELLGGNFSKIAG